MRSLNTTITALLPVVSLLVVGLVDPRRQRARGVRPRPADRPVLGRVLVDLHRLAAAGAAEGARAPLPRHQAPHRRPGRRRRRSVAATVATGRPPASRAAAAGGDRPRRAPAARAHPAGRRATARRRRPSRPSGRVIPPRPRKKATRQPPLTDSRTGAPAGRPLSSDHDARSVVAGRPPARHPRLPEAGHRVQGPDAAAADVDAFRSRSTPSPTTPPAWPVDKVVGIEARGFIFAAAVAYRLGAGFVPVRKAGKLPWKTVTETYELEYGTDSLEIHEDAVGAGRHGATWSTTCWPPAAPPPPRAGWSSGSGAAVAGLAFVVELGFLGRPGETDRITTYSA